MTWAELVSNLIGHTDKLKMRFPHVDGDRLTDVSERGALVDHVAQRHDLTFREAEEELSDWLDVESLARRAPDLRAG